ncbi:MAG: hypothetical protein V3V74_07190 [Nitrosomonadaceae bacterium]
MKIALLFITSILLLIIVFEAREFLVSNSIPVTTSKVTSYTKYDKVSNKSVGLGVHIVYAKGDRPIFALIQEVGSIDKFVEKPFTETSPSTIEFYLKEKKFVYSIRNFWQDDILIRCLLLKTGVDKPEHYMVEKRTLDKIFGLTKDRTVHRTWADTKKLLEKSDTFRLENQ